MINAQRPLQEKMALFWHGLFAAGFNKCDDPRVIAQQVDMFRRHGLGNFRVLLAELSRDPAMIYWLDNNQSRGDAPNENYGCVPPFSHGVSTRRVRLMKPGGLRAVPDFIFHVFSEVPCR